MHINYCSIQKTTTMNAAIGKWHFLSLVCDKEQVFSTRCGAASFPRPAEADSLATEKGRLLFGR